MIDFSKTLIRASATGLIMTEPREVAAKKNGEISKTAQGYLKKVYKEVKWGRKTDLQNKYTDKGKLVEEDSLTLLSLLDKRFYKKNDVRLTNEFFTGEPDIYEGESILKIHKGIDAKSSWDADTFLANIGESLDKNYWWQGQIYMDLTGATEWEVSFCLVDTPAHIIESEKRKLFYQMNVATEENPEYLSGCAEIEYGMTFNDIPPMERRIKFTFQKDEEAIQRARDMVVKCRTWLSKFEILHLGI